jgi:hypothetical protein
MGEEQDKAKLIHTLSCSCSEGKMKSKRFFLSPNGESGFIDKYNNAFIIEDLENILKNLNDKSTEGRKIKQELIDIGALSESKDVKKFKKILLIGNEILIKGFYKTLSDTIKEKVVFDNYNMKEIDLAIYINYFEDFDELRRLNKIFIRNDIEWIKCIILEETFFLGPEFIPNETCCYECLYTRLITNELDIEGFEEQYKILKEVYKNKKFIKGKFNEVFIKTAYSFLLTELINVSNNNYNCIDNEKMIDLANFCIKDNFILKVPGCDCND